MATIIQQVSIQEDEIPNKIAQKNGTNGRDNPSYRPWQRSTMHRPLRFDHQRLEPRGISPLL